MSPVHNFDPGASKKARYRPKMDKMAELWLLVIFGPFWPRGQNLGHTPHRHTPNSAKTSARMSCNLFHAVPTVLDHQSAQARALKPTSVIGHKKGHFGQSGPENGLPSSRTGTYRKTEGIQSYLRIRGRYEPIESSLSEAKKLGFKGVA